MLINLLHGFYLADFCFINAKKQAQTGAVCINIKIKKETTIKEKYACQS